MNFSLAPSVLDQRVRLSGVTRGVATKAKRLSAAEWIHIAKTIATGNATLFCGAGISAAPPSSLPVARELVDKVQSKFLCGLPKDVRTSNLRPEVLFQLIAKHDRDGLLADLSRNLGSVQPNTNHGFAATCLALGNHVVTTNFDLLIESACLAGAVTINRTTERLPKAVERVLFKIHGTLDEAESIFYTLNRVYQGLGRARSQTLQRLISNRVVLVFGYSGLDQLDIMPVLRRCRPAAVYWFNHVGNAKGSFLREAPNADVAKVPNIRYCDAVTTLVVRRLSQLVVRNVGSQMRSKTPRVMQTRIAVDILMHENRYRRVRELVRATKTAGDLHCRVANFEAGGSISKRSPAWRTRRDRMLQTLFALPEGKQRPFLGTMVKFVDSEARLDQLAAIVERELTKTGEVQESALEGAIELTYEYIWRRRYSDAEKWLKRVHHSTARSEFLLIEARRCIEEAYFWDELHANVSTNPQHVRRGLRAANKALYLLGDDMFADAFFYNQARVNKANLLRTCGRYREALSLYDAAETYFRGVSINSTLLVLYERAKLYFGKRDLITAVRELRRFIKEARSAGRRLWLGFLHRLHAQILYERQQQKRGISPLKIRRLLEKSAARFRDEGNKAEAAASISLLRTLRSRQWG